MKNEEIINHLQNIKNLSKSPMAETVAAHLQALIVVIGNDEYEQTKLEHTLDDDIILEHIDDILEREFSQIIEKQNSMESLKEFDSMRKRILNKLLQTCAKRTTPVVPVIQCHAVLKFWLANNNIRKDTLIELAFTGTENETNIAHYKEMFHGMNYDLFRFFEILSEDQRCLIIQYIMKNYSGVKVADVKKYVTQ